MSASASIRAAINDDPTTAAGEAVRVAVVIPCYRVREQILGVIQKIGLECCTIYVVDDRCPESSGQHVADHCPDSRVQIIWHEANQGVGGATLTGFRQAIDDGMDIVVKIDGDGQMDPQLIPHFILPIISNQADYTKGNRFFRPDDVRSMPRSRLLGNIALSFMTKASSGYWNLFDPTNGYTAAR